MVTIRNSEVYSGNPALTAPVLAALNDILRQRVERPLGKQLRKLYRAISTEVDDISAEHKRLLEFYARKDADGNPVPLQSVKDLSDEAAFTRDYEVLMNDTFVIEGVPAGLLDGMTLAGATWASPLIVEDGEGNEPPKEAAPAGDGAGATRASPLIVEDGEWN